MANDGGNPISTNGKCPHCEGVNKKKDPKRSKGRQGNFYHEQFVCVDCGGDFQMNEEIKARGN